MDGIKTALVGFILVCMVLPHIVKNRHQYMAAIATVLMMLVLDTLAAAFGTVDGGVWRFCHVMGLTLQMATFILLVLAAGGLSVGELAGDMARAYEVMRRGEEEKEIIIPLPGQVPGGSRVYGQDGDEEPQRYVINDPAPPPAEPAAAPAAPPPPPKSNPTDSIPLV